MNEFSKQIELIHSRMISICSSNPPPYIHCSKINSFLIQIKDFAENLSNLNIDQTKKLTNSMKANIINLMNTLDHFQQLHSQCCIDVCAQIALTTSMRIVKKEIISIRKNCIKYLELIGIPNANQFLGIDPVELELQDKVDIKRISVLLNQLQIRKNLARRPDISKHLSNRIKSLEDYGINLVNDEKETITIQDIPKSLNIIVRHSDILMGREIGVGQSGRVVLGILKPKNIEVAVKILHNTELSSSDIEMFKREIFSMSILNHQSLVKFYGYTSEPPFYILTEYMPNGSLYDYLHEHPNELSPTEKTLIALDIAKGLEYLHERGMIYRDLKSLNILLDNRKRAKICDFGLIRMKSNDPMTGLVGSSYWMAPEVLMSSPYYNEKVDVYSFGILLWELLTEERPYQNDDPISLPYEIVEKNHRPEIPDNVPINLKKLIEKCWDKDPKLRPSFHQIISDLSDSSYQFPGCELVVLIQETGAKKIIHRLSSTIVNNRNKRNGYTLKRSIQRISDIIINGNYEDFCDSLNDFKISACNENNDYEKLLPVYINLIYDSQITLRPRMVQILFQIFTKPYLICYLNYDLISNFLKLNDENIINAIYTELLMNPNPVYFNEETIKSLLKFSNYKNSDIRIKILDLLIISMKLNKEIFVFNPKLITDSFSFMNYKIPKNKYEKLLIEFNSIFPSINIYDIKINEILVNLCDTIPDNIKPLFAELIYSFLRFEDIKNVIPKILKKLLKDYPIYSKIFEFYISDKTIIDQNLIKKLCKNAIKIDSIISFLRSICLIRDDSIKIIIESIPIGNKNYELLSDLYSCLLNFPQILNILEFYKSSLYLLGKNESLINFFAQNDFKYQFVEESKIPSKLCSLLKENKTNMIILKLINVFSSKFNFIEFNEITPILIELLNSNYPHDVSYLSFRCILNILKYTQEQINFDILFQYSTKELISNPKLQQVCIPLFQTYLKKVNQIQQIIKLFITNETKINITSEIEIIIQLLIKFCENYNNIDPQYIYKLKNLVFDNNHD